MQVTFLNTAGTVLFSRDDMEQGNWTQEEYSVNATFPFVAGKTIERGQRMAFRDPATDTLEFFEVRNVTNIEPEHYQQIIAEHIVVAELSDDHIDTKEITSKTAAQALTTVLSGTLWSVGNSTVSGNQSADIARGSVWQAVATIMANWNCYIIPRVTVNAAGAITGRYLDISPAQGTWHGVRLSISKNMTDSSVVYDDTEVYTALYGYGGMVEKAHTGQDDTEEQLTFADVVWTATGGHPAKPAGQTYLEDPAKTALYGRNGRARFGYYQNGDIEDANLLLEKTWEALQETSSPKISITGTVSDLYRLGYTDQPLRLHDTVIVEVAETGEKFEKEIIKLDVDLLDPTATRPEIGDYIANIIYIDRATDEKTGGGGGGRAGNNKDEGEQYSTFSALEKRTDKYGSMIAMTVGTRNGNNYIKGGEIALSINEQPDKTAQTKIHLQADIIDIDGIVEALKAYDVTTETITTYNTALFNGEVTFNSGADFSDTDVSGISNLAADSISCDDISINGYTDVIVGASVNTSTNELTLTHADGTQTTFSKATSLDGAWSGGTLTVTASPQDEHLYVGIWSPRTTDITWNGINGQIAVYANKNGDSNYYSTGKTFYITAPNDWSYGSASSSSSSFSYDKNYTMNPNYAYHRFGVTVNGVTKYIQIHILQS